MRGVGDHTSQAALRISHDILATAYLLEAVWAAYRCVLWCIVGFPHLVYTIDYAATASHLICSNYQPLHLCQIAGLPINQCHLMTNCLHQPKVYIISLSIILIAFVNVDDKIVCWITIGTQYPATCNIAMVPQVL